MDIFKNLVVVELASVLAGPAVGMFFAELGAKVIKIENSRTSGDVTRAWKLPQEDNNQPLSAYYHSINWNKETHLLNLTAPKERAKVLELLTNADILIGNFKAGSAQKMGMDYETLSKKFPKLIYAEINAYGENNPKPGFDAMIQAETGWIYMNGEPTGNPVKMPVALMDVLAGHQLKEGILIALLQRAQTEKGCKVSVSLFDTGVASLTNQASNWLNVGVLPERKGSQHPNIAPYGDIFYTKDECAVILGTGTQKQFERLCHLLQLNIITDPRFITNTLRVAHRAALNQFLTVAIGALDFNDFYERCLKQGVTIAPVNNMKAVFDLPAAQELILEEAHQDGTVSKRVRTAIFKIMD